MTDKIISRRADGVGHVVFNNPERRNAVSLEMWQAVEGALDRFAADEEIRVVVLSGAGGKAFVSGADVSRFESERASEDATRLYSQKVGAANEAIYEFPKPTIAMIKGYCIGGGLGLAVCCDLRICSDNSKFGIPAAKLGLGYGYSGVKRLADLVGPAFTKEIFFTARQFDAEDARVMGLVNRIVKPDDLESYVKSYAETIAGNAPLTVKAAKFIANQTARDESKRDLAQAQAMVDACFASNDYTEGRRAFMEKRKPQFTGT
jgi:enoyl-CoA hydratase/carnithine racemase